MRLAVLGQGVVGRALTDALIERGYELDVFTQKDSAGLPYVTGGTTLDVKDIAEYQPGQYTWVINAMPAGVVVEAPANGVLLDWSGSLGQWWDDESPEPGSILRPIPPAQRMALAALRAVGLSHVLSADFTALWSVGRLGHKGVQRLAGETAKMLNGQGKDEGDIAFDLSVTTSSPEALVLSSELMPYQIGWGELVVPTFHGMAIRVSVLGSKNFGDETFDRLKSVGFEEASDISLMDIQASPDNRYVVGYQANGPRLSMTLGFDPVAQIVSTTLDLLDRPL